MKNSTDQYLGARNLTHKDQLHSFEINNFPIYLAPMISDLLDSIFTNYATNSKFLEAFTNALKSSTKNELNSSQISNLNGLFLSNIFYDKNDLDTNKLKFDAS